MKKKKYEAPQTRYLEVELEQGFMVQGSIMNQDKETEETISINKQDVGAESDYFTNDSEWDF